MKVTGIQQCHKYQKPANMTILSNFAKPQSMFMALFEPILAQCCV